MTNPFIIQENPKKIKDSKVLNYNQKLDSEFFALAGGQEPLKANINHQRLVLFFLLFVLLGVIFVGRLFYLQILRGKYWLTVAEGNRLRTEKWLPARGIIFDRQSIPLVSNTPNFVLSFIPADLKNQSSAEQRLIDFIIQQLPEVNSEEVKEKIKQADRTSLQPVEIQDHLAYTQAIHLMLAIKDYPSLRLDVFNQRTYLDSSYGLAHLLGYLGKINIQEWQELKNQDYLFIDWLGKNGLEKHYEAFLRGKIGYRQVEVDAFGRHEKIINEKPPQKGKNLILTIDANLNRVLSQELCAVAQKFNQRAAGLVMDPRDGGILAMASCPNFDNNLFSHPLKFSQQINHLLNNADQPLFNRVIQGEYPPGSIFKLVVAAAGLQEGLINEHSTFLSVGGIKIGNWFFPDWKTGGHGVTNLTKAIAESVNTFFYYLGGGYQDKVVGLGLEKIVAYAKKFGLSKPLGIDLPNEKGGFLPNRQWKEETAGRPWYIGDTYHLAIGQGDLTVTPLQVANLTNFLANYGTLYQPYVVAAIADEKNRFQHQPSKILNKDFIDQNYITLIRQGMRRAVTQGSARFLADLPVAVAGKTGTAQIGGNKKPQAWFTGFAPYEQPEIVITILVENSGEGSSVATPVAKKIFKWYFENKQHTNNK